MTPDSQAMVNPRFRLSEWLLIEALLHPGYRIAPGALRALRPLLVRAIWALTPGIRKSLHRNARILLSPNADQKTRRKFGLEVLSEVQRYIEDLIGGAIGRNCVPEAIIESEVTLDEYMKRRTGGGGIVLATAHMGSFEAAASLVKRLEKKVHVVYARDPSRSMERMRSRLRRRLGVVEHAVDDGVQTWRALEEALQRNEAVALPADRVQPGQIGFECTLLGRTTQLPAGPFKLAMATGAPLVPVFCWRSEDDTYYLSVGKPIEFPDGFTRELGTNEGVLEYVAAFEEILKEHPSQWLMVFEAWPGETT